MSKVSVPSYRPKVKRVVLAPAPAPAPAPDLMRNLFSDNGGYYTPPPMADIENENQDPGIRREKQEILFQLMKSYPSESQGQWTMKIPLFELKYELMRREQHRDEQDQLLFMKEMMKMILKGVEIANKKFGPILELDGWAESVTQDMDRYDRCLKALYHRYFKRKQMNPVMELLWLIVGSAAMWHLQNKFLGKVEQPHVQEGKTKFSDIHDIKPPPSSRFPFDQPGPAQGINGINLASILKLFAK
jgi:hypothetical protein